MTCAPWVANVSVDDIPSEQMRSVASVCGISDAIALMVHLPGIEIYVPAAGRKYIDHMYVIQNYTGKNEASLATHLNMNRDRVRLLSKSTSRHSNEFTNKPIRVVAEYCGEDVARRLMIHFSRYTLYVPKDGFSIARRKYIERVFDGKNVMELAIECGVTERHVRKIIADNYARSAQLSLFG